MRHPNLLPDKITACSSASARNPRRGSRTGGYPTGSSSQAERLTPDDDPPWLYWLDPAVIKFKADAYTQANCDNSSPCQASNYSEVVIYGLTVSHQN